MEGWMISLVFGFASVTGAGYIVKYQVGEAKKHIALLFERADKHGDDIVRLNTRSELSMTAKDVDDKYVSKELFRQFEKHMDSRFDRIDEGQNKILTYMENKKK